MIRRTFGPRALLSLVSMPILVQAALGQDPRSIQLTAPNLAGGQPLFLCLQERRSSREFAPEKLPVAVLSSLFWAAFGVNRPESEGRTAPSALNMQEIDLFAALPEGLFKYDPRT